METRARQAEATRRRILDAARDLFEAKSSGFTLDSVAARAGVSVQTVLRAFGSKESLLVAVIGTVRHRPHSYRQPASPQQAVRWLFDDYEEIGDRVIRMLAEEDQVTDFAEVARLGRENHRTWVRKSFGERLGRLAEREREGALTALVAATDVYVWKVLRRDMGLDRPAAEAAMTRLVRGAAEISEGSRKGS